MATNYQRGRAFEYRARNALTKRGAAYVMRAAQSKGAVDLLALWPVDVHEDPLGTAAWLVQCKYSINGGGNLPPAERRNLIDLAFVTGATPVLARPGKNGRGVQFINLYTNEEIVV